MARGPAFNPGKGVAVVMLLAALCCCLGWADSLEGLKKATGKITAVQAEFTQEKHLKILARPLISKGVMYFAAPDSLRWEYREPIQSVLLMHDGKTTRYQNNGQGFVEEGGANLPSMQVVLEQITQWLAGDFGSDPMFTVKMEPDRKIVLTPKEKGFTAFIQQIELHLADTPGVIKTVLIREGPDAFTRMDFSRTVINPSLPDTIFQKVP